MRVKRWIPIVTIVLMAVLCTFLLMSYSEELREAKIYQEWDYMRQPYSKRLDRLNRQLDDLEQEHQNAQIPKAVAQIVFTELDERIYTEGFPFLDEYGYTATLALGLTELPGMEGCLTTEQFAELMNAGWSVCVGYEGDSVDAWWSMLETELEARQIPLPEAVYFPKGTYQESMDQELEEIGFKLVIRKVEDDVSPIVLEKEEGLWHVNAMGFVREDAKERIEEAVEQLGNIVYCVGFEKGDELFQKDAFSPMLDCFEDYRSDGKLIVLNTDEARESFKSQETGVSPKFEKRYEVLKGRIQEKIAEVHKQLEELDSKYKNMQ